MNNLGEKAHARSEIASPIFSRKRGDATVQAPATARQEISEGAAGIRADQVSFVVISADDAGQRIDNFLFRVAKGVPKSHVYRIVRGGEVRVNKKRVDATYRLLEGDELRIPPLRTAQKSPLSAQGAQGVRPAEFPILFEDEALLIIDKPAGVAVHGGSGVSFGVIEQLRAARPQARFLELVHRLDRETSGVLMIAKKRSALVALHEDMREGSFDKRYLALVAGEWKNPRQHVKAPLLKYLIPSGEQAGERRVRVSDDGISAHTIFSLQENFSGPQGQFALLEAELKTGRTHQIRVHLAHLGFPIVGDEKYGDFAQNKELARPARSPHTGQLKRMFLHAWQLRLTHPLTQETLTIEASLPPECQDFLRDLRNAKEI